VFNTSVDATVQMPSLAATGAVGTAGVNVTVGLTGVAAVGAVSYVYPDHGYEPPLTGVVGLSGVGSMTVSVTRDIVATGSIGRVGSVHAVTGDIVSLSGVQSAGSPGTIAQKQMLAFVEGVYATMAPGMVTAIVSGVWVPGNGRPPTGWQPLPKPSGIWTPVDQSEEDDWTPHT
jgi:hypothetical protein